MHERVAGYTDAVLEDLGSKVGPVAGELEAFLPLLERSDDLRFALANSSASVPVRRAITQELLGKKLSRPTLDLLQFRSTERSGCGLCPRRCGHRRRRRSQA